MSILRSESTPEEQPPKEALKALSEVDAPAILMGLDYRILAASSAYVNKIGSLDKITGHHCYEISHGFKRPCDQEGESCPLKASIQSRHNERSLHIHLSPKGREFVEVEIQPFAGRNGQPAYFLEQLRPTLIASAQPSAKGMVGSAPAFNNMLELVQRVAREETTVLLLGESGTGKELIARAIHEASHRSNMPFVPVECSGLTEGLFESELFGHKKGAYTGAHSDEHGLVESAHKGTLFLDEIGEVSLQLQVKLLRLLESQTFRQVGSTESRYVDFRLVCATNRDLAQMVKQGEFRNDLYYRINAFPIKLPPLRQRREDIGLLAYSLLKRVGGKRNITLSKEALHCLERYSFPGNIRELQNILERARILSDGDVLLREHFPGICTEKKEGVGQIACVENIADEDMFAVSGVHPLEKIEEKYLQHLLDTYDGRRADLAKELGISLRTLTRKIQSTKPIL